MSEATEENPPSQQAEGSGGGPRQERPRRRGGGGGRFNRRRVCSFCVDKVVSIDYKEPAKLRRFISDRGKIEPRRKTGNCARHQRMLTTALKRARHVALLPFTAEHIHLTGVFPTRPDRFERRDRYGDRGDRGDRYGDRGPGGERYGDRPPTADERSGDRPPRDDQEQPERVDQAETVAQE
jgi:small subunit ribosomal protein S18